jgi:ribosome-binding factor A
MSNRTLRVNELILRELSDILHRRYQGESVAITLTEVRVSPDLHDARVFVSIVGDAEEVAKKLKWLRARAKELRRELSRRIILKHMPRFEYVADESVVRGTRILQVLDELGPPEAAPDALRKNDDGKILP